MTAWFLDACALINLYASGRLADVVQHLQAPLLVVPKVVEEAGWVFERSGLERGPRVPIDLTPLLDAGVLEIVSLTPGAQVAFIGLARRLDDGEAMTIAAALEREGGRVVTDDEAALRVLATMDTPVGVTSLALLRAALESCPAAELVEVLLNVRVCARYTPGARHPERPWWTQVLGDG